MISIPEMPSVVQMENQQNKGQEGDARVTASLKELFRRASTVQPLSFSVGRQPAAGQIPGNTKERNERGAQLRPPSNLAWWQRASREARAVLPPVKSATMSTKEESPSFGSCRSPLASFLFTALQGAHNALPSCTELSHRMGS